MNKEARKFVLLVQEMRQAQSRYFRTREYEDLRLSKVLEKRVDVEVDRLLASNVEKIGLFE